MAQVNKIDSNVTGLRYAEEDSYKVLPGSPIWYALEPNSYSDFGGQLQLLARNPINDGRQRKKGVITDLDASGGFNTDLTQSNLQDLLQGVMFADLERKVEFGGASEITNVDTSTDDFDAASGLDAFAANDLVFASGFTNAGNNGLHLVSAASATALTVTSNLVNETPPAAAKLVQVGYQFASATLDVVVSGSLPRLTRASGSKDFTDFGLIPGEWIYVGGDGAGEDFVNAQNNGWMRVRSVAASYIEIDKAGDTALTAETGTGLTIRIFFGRVLRNRTGSNIVRRTYNLERTLGASDDASPSQIQSEYLVGALANEFSLNINTADKITADVTFIAADNEQRTGVTGVKSGTRPTLVDADAFNTSSDFARIKMSVFTDGDESPASLFAFLTDINLTINNNASANKAVGTLGNFDVTAGTFEVSGTLTAYFSNVTAVQAVRNNSDVTFDIIIAKNNAGLAIDVPLIALGDARLNVEQDQAITLPLQTDAATGAKIDANLNHTLLWVFFDYLPTVAM